MDDKPLVLVPLYIYPTPGAWEPLLKAARTHREVHFFAIINPANGPGAGPLPDGNYAAALRQLAAEPNMSTLGYVHCSWGGRVASAVQADTEAYREWWRRGGLCIDGIFFDETPSEVAGAEWMAELARYAKDSWRRQQQHQAQQEEDEDDSHTESSSSSSSSSNEEGEKQQQPATIIYNPGVVVGNDYFRHGGADYVVVFEASEQQWHRLRKEKDNNQGLRSLDSGARRRAVAMIHSSRGGSSGSKARKMLEQVRSLGLRGLYVTDQRDGGYTRWPSAWIKFVDAVSRC